MWQATIYRLSIITDIYRQFEPTPVIRGLSSNFKPDASELEVLIRLNIEENRI